MSILCPVCATRIPADSRSCPRCAAPLKPASPTVIQRIAVTLSCLLILLALVVNIIGCFRGPTIRAFKHAGLCGKCGYPIRGLTEPRCPECGTPFDPKLLVEQAMRRERPAPDA